VTAFPDAGWDLSHWLLNGSNVASANPYKVTMDADYNLTAVFTKTAHVFEDGFETGDFSLWTGTTRTSGETTTISTDDKHHGSYSIVCARASPTGLNVPYARGMVPL